jgi:myo-inositol 2-dehydrogenase/D-chiro-inositol 1-dehydrogenase
MRVAVLGAGSMGGMHARLLGAMPDVEVLVVDADAGRAAGVATDCGGAAAEWSAALARANAVVIALPPELHAAALEEIVERDLPALCEKPLTEQVGTSRRLVELVESRAAHVEMGFQRRHDPAFASARASIADGSAGRLHLVRLTALDPRGDHRPPESWPVTEAAPIFLHSSVHDFDVARWLTGAEVVEVTADGSTRDGRRPDDPRGIETATVGMRFSNGTLATLDASWLHPGGYDIRAEILADRLHATVGLGPRTPARHLDWTDAGAPATGSWIGYLQRFEEAYRLELQAFLAAVRGERPPSSTVRDGLEALRVAVAATRSFVERRTVSLDEVA